MFFQYHETFAAVVPPLSTLVLLYNQEASLTTVNAEGKVDGHEATTQEAVSAEAERERLGQARGDAEDGLRQVFKGISDAQEKVLLVARVLKEEVVGGARKVFGECKSALETAIGRLLLLVNVCECCAVCYRHEV